MIRSTYYYKNGNPGIVDEYGDGYRKSQTNYWADGTIMEEIEWNENGGMLKHARYDKNGELESRWILEYDENNNNIKTTEYDKNDEIKYLSSLASYAEENALLEKKNLSFMKEEEAISNIEAFLSSLELGTSLGERETFALSKEDMLSIQNAMKSDEDYKSFYESGKFQEQIFDADDEMYYIKYSFSLDGVPVFGEGDPTVQMSGGVEQPLLTDPMGATFLFSNLGICEIRLTGMVNQLNIEAENQEIIRFDGIKKALVKKFGDVILSDTYNLSNMWLEYFPKRKEDSFDKVELIPVWCCKFDINGDINVDYALRFNAITGEEIS